MNWRFWKRGQAKPESTGLTIEMTALSLIDTPILLVDQGRPVAKYLIRTVSMSSQGFSIEALSEAEWVRRYHLPHLESRGG